MHAGALLEVDGLTVRYGKKVAVADLSFCVEEGEVVGIVGHNGAGKSSTLNALIGLAPATRGTVRFGDQVISGRSARDIIARGMALVPQREPTFRTLSVRDNLRVAARNDRGSLDENVKFVCGVFPVLEERLSQRAGSLSGGQQQMVNVASAVMSGPRVLLLDEPFSGLAPNLVQRLLQALSEIQRVRRLAIVIAEQNVRTAIGFADRILVLRGGRLVFASAGRDVDGAQLWKLF